MNDLTNTATAFAFGFLYALFMFLLAVGGFFLLAVCGYHWKKGWEGRGGGLREEGEGLMKGRRGVERGELEDGITYEHVETVVGWRV